jgi:hypothetical protein
MLAIDRVEPPTPTGELTKNTVGSPGVSGAPRRRRLELI